MVTTCVKNESFADKFCPHSHSDWEVVINLDGKLTTTVGGKSYSIDSGSVTVIPPGTVHSGKAEGVFRDMFFHADNLDFCDITVVHDTDGSIYTLMNMLHKAFTEREQNHRMIENNLVETICSYIKKFSGENYKYPFVISLKNTIYDNISNCDFCLGDAVNTTGFNKDYLRRCFKEVLGMAPLEYLTRLRINQAKTLLVQDNFISIEDVARNCGFNDSFYFSTCFKKHIGISPLRFRKNKLNINSEEKL